MFTLVTCLASIAKSCFRFSRPFCAYQLLLYLSSFNAFLIVTSDIDQDIDVLRELVDLLLSESTIQVLSHPGTDPKRTGARSKELFGNITKTNR